MDRLEGEHVVFGKVIQGMDNVFAIEGGAGTYSGKPRKKVVIVDSGEIPKDKWDEEWYDKTHNQKLAHLALFVWDPLSLYLSLFIYSFADVMIWILNNYANVVHKRCNEH